MGKGGVKPHTNQGQPYKAQADDDQQGQGNPQQRLDVDGKPEEATVGGVDLLGAGLARLEDPVAVARGRVDLVPPPQPDEAAAGDILEVVEVGREQKNRDDEDHDPEWPGRASVTVPSTARTGMGGCVVGGGGGGGGERDIRGGTSVHVGDEDEAEEVDEETRWSSPTRISFVSLVLAAASPEVSGNRGR